MSSPSPATRTPTVLTAGGRAWVEDRLERAMARLTQIDDELANERTEELVVARSQLADQVEELRQLLRDAVAPADVIDDPEVLEIGDEVEVRFPDGSVESFLLVHPVEAGMDEHRTSVEAPLARAVLGRRVGDEVTVTSPAGVYGCTILRRERIG